MIQQNYLPTFSFWESFGEFGLAGILLCSLWNSDVTPIILIINFWSDRHQIDFGNQEL